MKVVCRRFCSGHYGRTLITRVGKLELRVPQDRSGHFSTELFERYQRSERALVATLAEMYVQRGVDAEGQGDHRGVVRPCLLASSISAISKRLDESLKAFAERPLQEPFEAVIPAKAEPICSPVPMRRFRYDAKHDTPKCPRGKTLKAGRAVKHGRFFTSRAADWRDFTFPMAV